MNTVSLEWAYIIGRNIFWHITQVTIAALQHQNFHVTPEWLDNFFFNIRLVIYSENIDLFYRATNTLKFWFGNCKTPVHITAYSHCSENLTKLIIMSFITPSWPLNGITKTCFQLTKPWEKKQQRYFLSAMYLHFLLVKMKQKKLVS